MKILFLNGPPRSGKDTAAEYLHLHYDAYKVKFAKALKEGTHALFGLGALPDDHFENAKNKPNAIFFGMSPRQAYIHVSENLVKPVMGSRFFGKVALETIKRAESDGHDLVVISDSGFADEAQPIIEYYGQGSTYLLRILADKRGCTFDGDSRSYIKLDLPPDNIWVIENNDTPAKYYDQLDNLMAKIFPNP